MFENPTDGTKDFDGETYDRKIDIKRLSSQLNRVYEAMKDGQWRSLCAISAITGDPESSISARLRDLRKPKFGFHTVNRMRVKETGVFLYQLIITEG